MPQLGVWELLIVLVIVLLIFGASRLTGIGKGLGGAINAFRTEVKKGQEDKEQEGEAPDTSKAPAPETEPPEEQT